MTQRMIWTATAIAACMLAAGCQNKLKADVQVDGKPFVVTHCRSGQAFGFGGVSFSDDAGTTLAVKETGAFKADVILEPGHRIAACAALVVERQNSKINDISNVEGGVVFACKSDPPDAHTVTGSIEFGNCH